MQSAKLERGGEGEGGGGRGMGVKIEKGGGELCVFFRQNGGDVRGKFWRRDISAKKEERLDEKEGRTYLFKLVKKGCCCTELITKLFRVEMKERERL